MSADDMIKRGDAIFAVEATAVMPHDDCWSRAVDAIAALPAVTVGVRPLVWKPLRFGGLHAFCDLFNMMHYADHTDDAAKQDAARAARILAALDLKPAPDAAAIRQATARLHKLAYWLDTDAEVLADMDQRDLSDHQHIQAEVNAILALLPKGGA